MDLKRTCALCGLRPARYVCSRCGKTVCEGCFDTSLWLCTACLEELRPAEARVTGPWSPVLSRWLPIGMALVMVGAILMVISFLLSGQPGILLVFPFVVVMAGAPMPVITYALLALALALMVLMCLLALWTFRPVQRT
mgnify:CR=1 FL=1